MLKIIGLITVVYFVLIACGISPQAVAKKAIRTVNHEFMTPTERQVAKITEPATDAVDGAKEKVREAFK